MISDQRIHELAVELTGKLISKHAHHSFKDRFVFEISRTLHNLLEEEEARRAASSPPSKHLFLSHEAGHCPICASIHSFVAGRLRAAIFQALATLGEKETRAIVAECTIEIGVGFET